MSAPMEPRTEDVVQAALAKADFEFQELFGLQGQLEIAQLEGSRLQAELANATPVTVPASWARDIWPGEEPTHPQGIDVRTLRAQFAGTDPAHVPGRAR